MKEISCEAGTHGSGSANLLPVQSLPDPSPSQLRKRSGCSRVHYFTKAFAFVRIYPLFLRQLCVTEGCEIKKLNLTEQKGIWRSFSCCSKQQDVVTWSVKTGSLPQNKSATPRGEKRSTNIKSRNETSLAQSVRLLFSSRTSLLFFPKATVLSNLEVLLVLIKNHFLQAELATFSV